MKILVDMSLSPTWRETFDLNGFEAEHWSEIGNPKAKDREILAWAREHGFVVFTHDLDFGHLGGAAIDRPKVEPWSPIRWPAP